MTNIQLSRGLETIVDEDVYKKSRVLSWYAHKKYGKARPKPYYYACHEMGITNGKRKRVYLHRYVIGIEDPEILVDHINGNTLDNRKANLRPVTKSQNSQNMHNYPQMDRKSTPFKGVTLFKRDSNYRAYIKKDGKQIHIGYFKTPEEAAKAYDSKAKEIFGEYAKTNF